MKLKELVKFLDTFLGISYFKDSSLNGLQVERSNKEINRICLAVDSSLDTINAAIEARGDMLLCHHGLFWQPTRSLTSYLYSRVKALIHSDIAVYAAHLPLDAHPEVGNNRQIANLLHLEKIIDFGTYHGQTIGCQGQLPNPLSMSQIVKEISKITGQPLKVEHSGPSPVKTLGIISGGAAEMVEEAALSGLDLFLTGEPSHSYATLGAEVGVNVIYCGHYATEIFGVKALGRLLQERFKLETVFLHLPTGL